MEHRRSPTITTRRGSGTARGRVGLAVGPNLTYFTGGYAALDIDDANINTATGATVSSSKVRSGYALGSGLETMLGGGWTAKSEYMFTDFGDGDTLVNGGSLQTEKLRYHSQRFGVNYLFGAGNRGPLPQTNWNGFYVAGVYGVGAFEHAGHRPRRWRRRRARQQRLGPHGGGQVGWNWMIAPRIVVGLEGDISYLGIDHTSHNFGNNATSHFKVDTSWFATARGRLGYNTGPALLYVTGGGAWMSIEQSLTSTGGTASTRQDAQRLDRRRRHRNRAGQQLVEQERVSVRRPRQRRRAHRPRHGALTLTPDYQFHMFRSALVYRFN